MEFEFEYKDFMVTIDIEPGFACDDPAEWTLIDLKYVDGLPCDFEQISTAARQEIESKCESWAINKAYDAWCDRANSQADYLISAYKDK